MTTPPILVLGGTGTVGSRIARLLSSSSIPALIASRSGVDTPTTTAPSSSARGVPFDWSNRSTWPNPFEEARTAGGGGIKSVYLVAPAPMMVSGDTMASVMMDFVDFARERGARRFVLQSASAIEAGGPAVGKVHAYLRELGTRGEVEWAVLRPSWFQREFALPVVGLGGWGGGADVGGGGRESFRARAARPVDPRREQDLLGHGRRQDPVGVGGRHRDGGGRGADEEGGAEYGVFGAGAGVVVV